jgi:hypothetical protein
MCDPMTLLMGLASVAGPLLSKPPKPPAAVVPAAPAPNSRNPGATVRIGTGALDKRSDAGVGRDVNFVEKRKAGQSLGGLGRSGLAL